MSAKFKNSRQSIALKRELHALGRDGGPYNKAAEVRELGCVLIKSYYKMDPKWNSKETPFGKLIKDMIGPEAARPTMAQVVERLEIMAKEQQLGVD